MVSKCAYIMQMKYELGVVVYPAVGTALVSSPASTTVLEHNSLTLVCEFSGNPAPTIIWEREGSDPLPFTRASIVTTNTMHENYTLYTVQCLHYVI